MPERHERDRWPALPYDEWRDTYATLHMWTQVIGKVALAASPPLNHCWGIALHVTPRGLSTPPLPHGGRSFSLEFDFIDHRLRILTSVGEVRTVRLEPRTVADFYHEVTSHLRDLHLDVSIWSMPVEVSSPVRFEEDVRHGAYDGVQAHRFWQVLVQAERVFTASRCGFVGKCSPVNFFWGSFDLAITRFSGRPAPPRQGPPFERDAYSHEVISHGFWPGSEPLLEPAFYAYAVPPPPGLSAATVQPDGAYYHLQLGEFILPYEAVRAAPSPDRALGAFIDSTYAAAATLAHWDRAALER